MPRSRPHHNPRYLIKNEILPWCGYQLGIGERVWGGDSEDEDKIAFEYPFGSTGSEANLIKREFSLCKSQEGLFVPFFFFFFNAVKATLIIISRVRGDAREKF